MNNADQIAQNFYNLAFSLAPNPLTKRIMPEELKNYYVVWDGETVEEIATGVKISEHNWAQKSAKIDNFRKDFHTGKVKQTQIFVVKDIDYLESLIIDGIHRSVGFYKAYLEDPEVILKTDFTYKLFESNKIKNMHDYKRLFG